MQVSIEVKPELYKFLELTATSLGKSVSEIVADKFQPEIDEIQKAKKEMDSLLQPAITAIDNGEVFEVTIDEIMKDALENVEGNQ